MTKIKTLAKNTGSDSLPVFLASVLILVTLVTRTKNVSRRLAKLQY